MVKHMIPNRTIIVNKENLTFVISNVILSQDSNTFTPKDIIHEMKNCFNYDVSEKDIKTFLKKWRDNGLVNDLGDRFKLCL